MRDKAWSSVSQSGRKRVIIQGCVGWIETNEERVETVKWIKGKLAKKGTEAAFVLDSSVPFLI